MSSKLENIAPAPQGNYLPATRFDEVVFTSGMTPRTKGILLFKGKINSSEPLENYKESIRLATYNAFNSICSVLDESEEIKQILNMNVFIAADREFESHTKLADYASEYLYEVLGNIGIGSRTAVGVATLPSNASVEIQLVAQVGTKKKS